MRSQNKDILCICKGRFLTEESYQAYDALVRYYKKYYSENYKVSKKLLLDVLLKPAFEEFLSEDNKRSFVDEYLFKGDVFGTWGKTNLTYHESLYYRIIEFLSGLRVMKKDGTILIDLSGYEDIEVII